MADTCIECDVAIVGSGFAGIIDRKGIESEPSHSGSSFLEAGPGVQPNINGYMRSFYKASIKVPESPYPPALARCSIRRRRRQANVTHASASNWNRS